MVTGPGAALAALSVVLSFIAAVIASIANARLAGVPGLGKAAPGWCTCGIAGGVGGGPSPASSGAVTLRSTGASARQPPMSNRRLVVPSEDPSVPRGWEAKPDGTFVSPNGNAHAKLPANLATLYHGLGSEWEIDYDAGDAYYINANDGTTHWERPGPAHGFVNPLHK